MAVVVLPFHAFALAVRFRIAHLRVLVGMWKRIGKKRQQARRSDVVDAGYQQHRKDLFRDNGLSDPGNQIRNRNCAFPEELLHQLVVTFRHHLNQFLMRLFGFIRKRRRDFFDRRLPVSIRLVDVRFHGHEINHAAKPFFRADGQLQCNHVASKNLFQRFHGALKARQFAVHPRQNERPRNVVLRAIIPDFFRGHLHSDVRVHGDERRVRGD